MIIYRTFGIMKNDRYMSPLVEAGRGKEIRECALYFTVNLRDAEGFDEQKFDNFARKLSFDPEAKKSYLKYLVIDDIIYVFSPGQNGRWFNDILRKYGVSGELQSAGCVEVFHDPASVSRRNIYNIPENFDQLGDFLSYKKSDKYRKEIIEPILKDYFDFASLPSLFEFRHYNPDNYKNRTKNVKKSDLFFKP